MAPRQTAYKTIALGLLLCGTAFAAPMTPVFKKADADFARFAAQYPELAPALDANDVRHPAEADLIETLMSSNPGIRDFIDDVKKDQLRQVKDKDTLYRLHAVEVGPDQHPKVHQMGLDCAKALGLHTDFKIFILSNPEMQDDIFGIPRHGHIGNSFGTFTILLTSGMVKAMSEDELRFVIGREMGHVKANHRFYTALAFRYQMETGMIPRIYPEDKPKKMPGLGGTITFFFTGTPAPSRISEYTADRAGLVAVRSREAGISALAKIARGDLEGTPGFDLASYMRQVESAAADMTPHEAAELAAGEGYLPFVLNRVGEVSRFGLSEQYKALIDRATVNPFLHEVETLWSIGTSLAHYRKRLEDFKADPATARLDPMVREVTIRDLTAKVDARAKAVAQLEGLVLDHVTQVGLATDNQQFLDLIGTAKRRADARPLGSALDKLSEQIVFALQQPNLPPADQMSLAAKKAGIEAVRKLAPVEKPRPHNRPPLWVEVADLPALVNGTLATLTQAAAGDREAFFAKLDELKPELRTAALKLYKSLAPERRAALAELVASQGGQVAQLVAEVQAASTNDTSLEALFDRHFDRARGMLKVVPLWVIRRALARYAGMEL